MTTTLLLTLLVLVLVGGLWLRQEAMIFPVRHNDTPVSAEGVWQVGRVEVPGSGSVAFLFADDGRESGAPVLLFLHGNGSSARMTARGMDGLARSAIPVVAAEYPGYSGNPGTPTEASLRAAADATAAWARARWPGRRLAVLGESIGSAPAVHLAAMGQAGLLVLDSGFTSMTETIRVHMPWLPAPGWLNRHPMDNLAAIRGATGTWPQTLILISANDPVVPAAMGERMAAAIPGSTVFRSARPGHPVLPGDPVAVAALRAWMTAARL